MLILASIGTAILIGAIGPTQEIDPVFTGLGSVPEERRATQRFEETWNLQIGASFDKEKAEELLSNLLLSAANGDTNAMIRLGLIYKDGVGVLQNYESATGWIRKAADAGDPRGMLELGRLYRDGVGLGVDPVLAYIWFNRAAAGLNMDAVQDREDVARRLTPEQLRDAQIRSAPP